MKQSVFLMRKQAALRRVIRLIFLQRSGQLVRAARAVAALNALQAADGLIHGHADDQRGDALRVAAQPPLNLQAVMMLFSTSNSMERLQTLCVL